MLTLSRAQIAGVSLERQASLLERVDAWLAAHVPDWAALASAPRRDRLSALLARAEAAGMEVETDYALFARIAVTAPGGEDAFLARSDVAAALAEERLTGAAKVLRLRRLSQIEEGDDG